MKTILKGVKTQGLIEFLKQFKGFSESLYLEVGPDYLRSRLATTNRSKARGASIAFDGVVEEMSKEKEFRAVFYSIVKVINALKFESVVDLEFSLFENSSILHAKSMKIIGENVRLTLPCMNYDMNQKTIFLSDEIMKNATTIREPNCFVLSGVQIKKVQNMAQFLGDSNYKIVCDSDGTKICFDDGMVIINEDNQMVRSCTFSVDNLKELNNNSSYNCELGPNRIVLYENDKDNTTMFSKLVE